MTAVFAVAGACASASDTTLGDSGEADGADEVPQDLRGELLGLEDLAGGWDTAGPEELESEGDISDVPSYCPGGEAVALDDRELNVGAPGNATITFRSTETDGELVQQLYHDPTGALFGAIRGRLDSCVGEEWEQGTDPVENVTLEAVDVTGHGDAAAGYRELWGSSGEYYGQDILVVVRIGAVSLVLTLSGADLDDAADDVVYSSLDVAVGRLEDGSWAVADDQPLAPEVDEPASVTVEVNEFGKPGLVVQGNGGCRFQRQDDAIIFIMDAEELDEPEASRVWTLAPNVEWLVEQAFAIHTSVDVTVLTEEVVISLYEEVPSGVGTAFREVDPETAEQAAEDLRQRLGHRSVCPEGQRA